MTGKNDDDQMRSARRGLAAPSADPRDDSDLVHDDIVAHEPGAFSQLRHTDLIDSAVDSIAWRIM